MNGNSSAERSTMDVLIDTDIGTDVDDAYAILLALASPELNVRGITLVHAHIDVRAKIAMKLLKLTGRTDVPVALGERTPLRSERPVFWMGHEGKGLDLADAEQMQPLPEHAVTFIARLASENPGKLTLITIGPMTNAGMLVRDHPREAACLRGIVSMASTFLGFGRENSGREHNAAVDPEAVDLVLRSGIPILLVGLNVTQQTWLTLDNLAQISSCRNELSSFMCDMTREWFKVVGKDAVNMHDPLAIATAFDPELVKTIPVSAEVDLTSEKIAYHDAGMQSNVSICAEVDSNRFHKLFFERITKIINDSQDCQ